MMLIETSSRYVVKLVVPGLSQIRLIIRIVLGDDVVRKYDAIRIWNQNLWSAGNHLDRFLSHGCVYIRSRKKISPPGTPSGKCHRIPDNINSGGIVSRLPLVGSLLKIPQACGITIKKIDVVVVFR